MNESDVGNDYVYCPICGDEVGKWSGFWPDDVFQIRRGTVACGSCKFKGEIVVTAGEQTMPNVDMESLRDNNE